MFKCLMSARKSIYFSLLIILLFFLSCQKDVASKSYFPETGRNAIYQSSIDLRRNLKVLSISMQPGQEDLSGLAYFRLGLGAKIMGAYITNGEGDIQNFMNLSLIVKLLIYNTAVNKVRQTITVVGQSFMTCP